MPPATDPSSGPPDQQELCLRASTGSQGHEARFHLQNLRFVRVLRTRDRIVRSCRLFIHGQRARLSQVT